MKKTDTHAFVNQLLVYTLVMICFSGSIGLGTVWLRHQISLTANSARALEARANEIERHLAETKAAVESAQNPAMLEMLNKEWKLGLQRPTEQQVQRITIDPVRQLAAKRNAEIFTKDRPAAITFQVALKH